MRKIIAGVMTAIAGVVTAVVMVITPTNTANAGTACEGPGYDFCAHLRHYSPDDDYDDPIIVTCGWRNSDPNDSSNAGELAQYVYEGNRDTCKDVDGIYVRNDEEIWCKYPVDGYYYWKNKLDAQGWHYIQSLKWGDGEGCTVRRD